MDGVRKPIPVPSSESQPYWTALKEQRLLIPHCKDCGHWWFPPATLCPNCNSEHFSWAEASGRGKVFSYVVFHRVYHPGFKDDVPYVVALIELEEGPRLLSNLVNIEPDQVVCDLPVDIVYESIGEWTLPKFKVRLT